MADALHVDAVWQGGLTALTSARGHEVLADEPIASGGGDLGMMPTELFCAALASCFCLAVAHVAAKRDVELAGLRGPVDAQRQARDLLYGRFLVGITSAYPEADLSPLVDPAKPFCWV